MHPLTSITCAISLLAATGLAQGSYGPTGGQQLFSIGGALSRQSIDVGGPTGHVTTTMFNAQAGVGYFLSDVHEVGVQLSESYTSPDTGDDSISTGIAPYYNYNFRQTPRTWFYVGAHAGAQLTDQGGTSDTAIAYGIHGGVRHWLSQSAAIFVEPRYTITEFDGFDVETQELIFGYSVVL